MRVWLCSLVVFLAVVHEARAQAWVAEPGAIEIGLDYNLAISDTVVGESMEFPDSGTTTHQITLDAEYTPIERLAVTAALPFVALKYTGNKTAYPHPGGGRYDDGDLHGTLTDLRFGGRYQLLDEPVALAPHLAVTIPVADYEVIGNSVAGRHLKKLHLGLSAGYIIGLATYVHLLGEFSLAEKFDRTAETEKYSQHHVDGAFTVGHKLLDFRLDIHLDLNMRHSLDGVALDSPAGFDPNHDAILKEQIFLAGGGVNFQINNQINVSLSGRLFVAGNNTQTANVFAVGLSWTPRAGAE